MSADPTGRSLLFLSCDLVGSTSFKQVRQAKGPDSSEPPWQQTFLEFYRTFPQLVAQRQAASETGVAFDLWKPIGDELIMTVHVAKEEQVYEAVRLWQEAIDEYAEQVGPQMSTKGGAFIATFPGPDSEVAVPRQPITDKSGLNVVLLNDQAFEGDRDHGKYVYDYFGPSIDTGFRIFSMATPRYFPVSVEVAWALFAAKREKRDHDEIADIVYRGGHELKGVWNGRDYPLFAIDRRHDDAVNRAVKDVDSSAARPDIASAIELCRSCVEAEGWPSSIHLPEADEKAMVRAPQDPLARMRGDNKLQGAEEKPLADGLGTERAPDDRPLGD